MFGSQDAAQDCPRAVVHLINKLPDLVYSGMSREALREAAQFSQEDVLKLESLVLSIGRCLDNINKVEQLHSMSELSQGLL